MNLAETVHEIEYLETDGKPMGDTEWHVHWTSRLRDILKCRYRDQSVYIGADMFIYYVQGKPQKNVCPDIFVVLDCDPAMRGVFKVWEERRVPSVVIEVTSRSTWLEDHTNKPQTYARLGVAEYFLYDPRGEFLSPPLQGMRLVGQEYESMEVNHRGQLECQSLGITLELDGLDLLLRDLRTGEILPTEAEEAEAARDQAEAARKDAERERDAIRAQYLALQAEIVRLRSANPKQ